MYHPGRDQQHRQPPPGVPQPDQGQDDQQDDDDLGEAGNDDHPDMAGYSHGICDNGCPSGVDGQSGSPVMK